MHDDRTDWQRRLGVGEHRYDGRRARHIREGVTETGRRYKVVRDENNATIRESSATGASGVSDRQDVHLRPGPINVESKVQ